jgi:hypothetical protein
MIAINRQKASEMTIESIEVFPEGEDQVPIASASGDERAKLP